MIMRRSLLVHAGKCISKLLISLLFSTRVSAGETLSPRDATAVFSHGIISTQEEQQDTLMFDLLRV